MTTRGSSDPYYDIVDDYDLIVSSFSSQYGIRLYTEDINKMSWTEFKALISGLGPDTALGRVISVRSENDPDVLKSFTPAQKAMRSGWKRKRAKLVSEETMESVLASFQKAFMDMAGYKGGIDEAN